MQTPWSFLYKSRYSFCWTLLCILRGGGRERKRVHKQNYVEYIYIFNIRIHSSKCDTTSHWNLNNFLSGIQSYLTMPLRKDRLTGIIIIYPCSSAAQHIPRRKKKLLTHLLNCLGNISVDCSYIKWVTRRHVASIKKEYIASLQAQLHLLTRKKPKVFQNISIWRLGNKEICYFTVWL